MGPEPELITPSNFLSKASFPTTITSEFRASTYKFVGGNTIQPIIHPPGRPMMNSFFSHSPLRQMVLSHISCEGSQIVLGNQASRHF